MDTIKGRVRKFGDNIDTDTITPANTLQLPTEEMIKHAFSPVFPNFYETVQEGDIIVAGNNFGCGSAREQAIDVVKHFGISFIVCESMARTYFRNCIALGIYPLLAEGISSFFSEGDEIEINFQNEEIKNVKTGETAPFKPLSGLPKQIFDGGGILPLLKEKLLKDS